MPLVALCTCCFKIMLKSSLLNKHILEGILIKFSVEVCVFLKFDIKILNFPYKCTSVLVSLYALLLIITIWKNKTTKKHICHSLIYTAVDGLFGYNVDFGPYFHKLLNASVKGAGSKLLKVKSLIQYEWKFNWRMWLLNLTAIQFNNKTAIHFREDVCNQTLVLESEASSVTNYL